MAEHSYRIVPNEGQAKTFRCKVNGNGNAKLIVSSTTLKINVRETTGSGFTLGIPQRYAKKIKQGKRYQLFYDERRVDVVVDGIAEPFQNETRIFVSTVREYEPKEYWSFRLPFTKGSKKIKFDLGIDSGIVYGGFVLVIFCVMALPGLGTQLGTASRIESAIELVGRNVAEMVHHVIG